MFRRLLIAAWLLLPTRLAAQDWLFLDGIVDGEFWATDSGSVLLTRNDGHPAPFGRLQLFAGVDLRQGLQLLALGELEAGKGGQEGKTEVNYDQLVLRYTRSPALTVNVGKFATPVGSFANRRFSPVNPLIGSPDGYPVLYPWGIQVGGAGSRFDYRVALVSLPYTHENYVPDPSAAPHLVLGAGITPSTGLRFGASFSLGPYLNRDLSSDLPPGSFWDDYSQTVGAVDAGFSRGYFEFHGEAAVQSFQVPTMSKSLTGFGSYLEFKYTFSPRFFAATRLEYNKYAYIEFEDEEWKGELLPMSNGEIGVGYRPWSHTIIKLSYRRDHWSVDAAERDEFPTGNAVAVQISQSFDLKSWFSRKQ
jgi:hypothetical protein